MRYSSTNNNTKRQSTIGFTLIEMLIIAPIVILAIGGFIALMVNMVGSVLSTRDETAMTYQGQDALTSIEDDIRLSARFLTTTGTVANPQGSNNNFAGTAAFTNTSNTLILYTLATTKNPLDSSRELVYYVNQPNSCGAQKAFNKVVINKIVYFIKDGSLWRRTIEPNTNTNATPDAETVCTAPWQQNSCSPGYTVVPQCEANDIELMKNVSALNVEYYTSPSSTVNVGAANAESANSLKVSITGSKSTAGRTVGATQSTRATRINVSVQPPTVIPLQFTQHPSDTAVIATDTNVQFDSSVSISRAALQWQRSTDGGANYSDISGATSSSYTLATVSLSNNNYRYRVKATADGVTITSNPAKLTVTTWGNMDFQNNYTNFSSPYTTFGYTKTTGGVVMLKGMVSKPNPVVAGETIGVLPPGYRPSGVLIFETSTNDSTVARIDVYPDGRIVVNIGDAGWISLDGITFIPAGTSFTRNPLTTINGWVNYGGSYALPTYAVDSVGRINVQGLIRNGTLTDGTPMVTTPPASALPGDYLHVPARNGGYGLMGVSPVNGLQAKGAGANGYQSLNVLYYPASFAGWSNLALQNSWVAFGGGYATPQYAKGSDNIVRLKGLIKSGATGAGTVVTNLPAGYRPKERTLLSAACNPNVYCRMDVLPNGNVELYLSNAGWTSLDNIVFLAEL